MPKFGFICGVMGVFAMAFVGGCGSGTGGDPSGDPGGKTDHNQFKQALIRGQHGVAREIEPNNDFLHANTIDLPLHQNLQVQGTIDAGAKDVFQITDFSDEVATYGFINVRKGAATSIDLAIVQGDDADAAATHMPYVVPAVDGFKYFEEGVGYFIVLTNHGDKSVTYTLQLGASSEGDYAPVVFHVNEDDSGDYQSSGHDAQGNLTGGTQVDLAKGHFVSTSGTAKRYSDGSQDEDAIVVPVLAGSLIYGAFGADSSDDGNGDSGIANRFVMEIRTQSGAVKGTIAPGYGWTTFRILEKETMYFVIRGQPGEGNRDWELVLTPVPEQGAYTFPDLYDL